MSDIKKKYLQMFEELKSNRAREAEILDRMGLLWQAMTLEERDEVDALHLSWPPPASGIFTAQNRNKK